MRGMLAAVAWTLLLASAGLAVAQGEDGEDPEPEAPDCPEADEPSCPTPTQDGEDEGEPSDDGEGEGSGPGGAEDRLRECLEDAESAADERECKARHCHERPDDVRCQRPATPGPTSRPDPSCAFEGSGCDDDGEDDDSEGPRGGDDDRPRAPRHVRWDGDLANLTVRHVTVDGVLLLDRASYLGEPGETDVARDDGAWTVRIDDDSLRIHDIPTGLIGYRGGDDGEGAFELDLPDRAVVERRGEGARIGLAGGHVAFLVAPGATWIGDTVVTDGFLSIHLSAGARDGPDGEGGEDGERRGRIREAIEDRRVGAQVKVDGGGADVRSFDDVKVEVAVPGGGAATEDDPLRIEVSSHLPEGRTIVLDINETFLLGDELRLRYFDVHDDGGETEVYFLEADGLEDVLDATDDGGQPEYWVVQDEDGIQLLVSVPRWSVHAITVASLEAALPSVLVGIGAGFAGAALAATLLLWPRRPDEE